MIFSLLCICFFFFYCLVFIFVYFCFFFFFKQKTAYEMRISDWSSDVCSSDLLWSARPCWMRARRTRRLSCLDNGPPLVAGVPGDLAQDADDGIFAVVLGLGVLSCVLKGVECLCQVDVQPHHFLRVCRLAVLAHRILLSPVAPGRPRSRGRSGGTRTSRARQPNCTPTRSPGRGVRPGCPRWRAGSSRGSVRTAGTGRCTGRDRKSVV